MTILMTCISGYAQSDAQNVISNEMHISVLATISEIDDDYVYAELYDTVGIDNSVVKLPQILKIKKFKYTYCNDHADSYNVPKLGDNIFIGVEIQDDKTFSISGVAYRTDTVDMRTLNVYAPVDMKNKDCMSEIAAIAYFIRSGGLERNIVISDNAVYFEQDGERTKLYPAEVEDAVPVIYVDENGLVIDDVKQQDVINVLDNPIDQAREVYNAELVFAKRIIAVGIIFIGLIVGIIVIYVVSNKRKSRGI